MSEHIARFLQYCDTLWNMRDLGYEGHDAYDAMSNEKDKLFISMSQDDKKEAKKLEAEKNRGRDKVRGLYNKYEVKKTHGETDPKAVYWVLRLDENKYARQAAALYAYLHMSDYPKMATELLELLQKLAPTECFINDTQRLDVLQSEIKSGNFSEVRIQLAGASGIIVEVFDFERKQISRSVYSYLRQCLDYAINNK